MKHIHRESSSKRWDRLWVRWRFEETRSRSEDDGWHPKPEGRT